ncbi:MAG TPA: 2-hydroxy-3-oxopropionate reductase [Thermomicrobiales bacterium]|nr:2-hydroxy-3-oxopropionate reductase [Thermomicrobiales bacterium]
MSNRTHRLPLVAREREESMAEKIGFIGLGIMGKPMARNLAKAGYQLVIHSRTRASVDELVNESDAFQAASSPKEVAEQVKTIITMLPDSPDVRDVVFGENGLAGAMGDGQLLIDMSTIAPATSVEVHDALTKKGATALDAPVSGGDKGAIAGTLSIMVGGSEEDFNRAKPLFEAMGKTIVLVGGPGAGQTVKACNQIVVAIHFAAASEALVLGAKAGVDPEKIIQVLTGGLAASRVMEMRGPTMIQHNFQPGFRVDLHRKDLAIAMDTGKEYGVPLITTAVVGQLFEALHTTGRGDLDHSALIALIEDLASYKVGQ